MRKKIFIILISFILLSCVYNAFNGYTILDVYVIYEDNLIPTDEIKAYFFEYQGNKAIKVEFSVLSPFSEFIHLNLYKLVLLTYTENGISRKMVNVKKIRSTYLKGEFDFSYTGLKNSSLKELTNAKEIYSYKLPPFLEDKIKLLFVIDEKTYNASTIFSFLDLKKSTEYILCAPSKKFEISEPYTKLNILKALKTSRLNSLNFLKLYNLYNTILEFEEYNKNLKNEEW